MARPARPERNSAGSTGLNFKKRENNRDPAIVAALDHFAYFILQRRLGSPSECFSDQPDMIANFETGFQLRILLHFAFAFSPRRAGRKSAPCRVIICERNRPIS
jgi:hypothetical protein